MLLCYVQPMAKLSDSPDKNVCDGAHFLVYLRWVFEIPRPV